MLDGQKTLNQNDVQNQQNTKQIIKDYLYCINKSIEHEINPRIEDKNEILKNIFNLINKNPKQIKNIYKIGSEIKRINPEKIHDFFPDDVKQSIVENEDIFKNIFNFILSKINIDDDKKTEINNKINSLVENINKELNEKNSESKNQNNTSPSKETVGKRKQPFKGGLLSVALFSLCCIGTVVLVAGIVFICPIKYAVDNVNHVKDVDELCVSNMCQMISEMWEGYGEFLQGE